MLLLQKILVRVLGQKLRKEVQNNKMELVNNKIRLKIKKVEVRNQKMKKNRRVLEEIAQEELQVEIVQEVVVLILVPFLELHQAY
jgi:hypothetical protein